MATATVNYQETIKPVESVTLVLTAKEAAVLFNLLYNNVGGYDDKGGHRETLNDITDTLKCNLPGSLQVSFRKYYVSMADIGG